MGSDIHLYIEKRNKSNKWEVLILPEDLIPNDRNYRLFYFLAEVRMDIPWEYGGQVSERGIPEDCSIPDGFMDTDSHGYTYAYLDEILALPWKAADLDQCFFYLFFRYIFPRIAKDYNSYHFEEARNIRIVMWFDS